MGLEAPRMMQIHSRDSRRHSAFASSLMLPIITLTILTNTFAEFERQVRIASTFLPYIQIDVMDGKFVPGTSFTDIEKINSLDLPLKYELHLMVADPVAEMRKWQPIEQVFRVLFHYEAAAADPLRPISFARKEGWDVGMVINPDTPLSAVEPYLDKIDVLQFMTVYPGQQGAPFVPKVLEKIKTFTKRDRPLAPAFVKAGGLAPSTPQRGGQGGVSRPLCAVDGAVNKDTIQQLKDAGVEIFNVGSAFTKAPDMKLAYEELLLSLREGLA